ncbi:MAG TPA: hypothetical protein VN253_20465 [Kofleriaceae bacterium]|nr:hypothetical protein [Kofleriaceae bacterium]
MSKRLAAYVLVGCIAVLAGAMVLAVVLNRREAREFDENGLHVTGRVTAKRTWSERVARIDRTHYCLSVAFEVSGTATTGSACDAGIDQIWDKIVVGDPIRIVYLPGRGVMLEDWATGKLTSF